jgi:L-alanine-DL-glutamate epimerase-like enolase superfamily enzyme
MHLPIVKLAARRLDVPLERPFTIALGTMRQVTNVLVELSLEDGVVGLGEAAPFPELTGETQATCLAAIDDLEGLVVGQDAFAYRRISRSLAGALFAQTSARAAVEMALLDALTHALALPLHRFLGGARTQLSSDVTIPIEPPDEAARQAAKLADRGITIIKTKVGGQPEADIERVLAIVKAAPGCRLILDANQGFSPKEAVRFLDRLAGYGVQPVLYEQPVERHDLEGLRYVRERVRVPVAADEAVSNAADAMAIARASAADVVNIKLMKCGGLVEALDIVSVCRAANIGLMIGGMIESRVGMNAAAHLACGTGAFEFVDLDTHLVLADDPFEGGFEQDGPRIDLSKVNRGAGIRLAGGRRSADKAVRKASDRARVFARSNSKNV